MTTTPETTAAHGQFTLRRRIAHPPARVFAAYADATVKRTWFADTPGAVTDEYRLDCRTGGSEHWSGRFPDGPAMRYDAQYVDVRPDARILIAYWMAADDTPFSASVHTVEFRPDGDGCDLVITEQVTHLDGFDTTDQRKAGVGEQVDQLVRLLG